MDRAGPGGGIAKADLAGEFGVSRRHEGGHLLVPDLDVLQIVFGLLQRHVQAADAVAGIAIDALKAPFLQAMPYEFADIHPHGVLRKAQRRTEETFWLPLPNSDGERGAVRRVPAL